MERELTEQEWQELNDQATSEIQEALDRYDAYMLRSVWGKLLQEGMADGS